MNQNTSLQELLAQKAAIDEQIELARQAERNSAISEIKELITAHGLSAADIFGPGSRKPKTKTKVPAKFRDPASGSTWTGRGKPPVWIAGRDRAEFAIQ